MESQEGEKNIQYYQCQISNVQLIYLAFDIGYLTLDIRPLCPALHKKRFYQESLVEKSKEMDKYIVYTFVRGQEETQVHFQGLTEDEAISEARKLIENQTTLWHVAVRHEEDTPSRYVFQVIRWENDSSLHEEHIDGVNNQPYRKGVPLKDQFKR